MKGLRGVGIVLAICLGLSGLVIAAPNLGTWNAPADFDSGLWYETYPLGGEDQPGNPLVMYGLVGLDVQWVLTATLSSVVPILPDQNLRTYTNGVLTLNNGPWTGAGDLTYTASMGDILMYTDETGLTRPFVFNVISTGVVNGYGLPVEFWALYGGAPSVFEPWPGTFMRTALDGTTAVGISIIPAPGAIILAGIGAGLVCRLHRRRVL